MRMRNLTVVWQKKALWAKLNNYIKMLVLKTYEKLFARKRFQKINHFLYLLALRGKGIDGSFDCAENGEESFIKNFCMISKKDDFIVFDIGANEGDYSNLILKYRPDA